MKLAIKVLLVITALLVIVCGFVFYMMYEPDRAMDREVSINKDMTTMELIEELPGTINFGGENQVAISEDLINYGFDEYLGGKYFSADGVYVNYSYVDLGEDEFTIVAHLDVETEFLTFPTIVKLKFATSYVEEKIVLIFEEMHIGSVKIPDIIVKNRLEKLAGNLEEKAGVNSPLQYGYLTAKDSRYEDKMSYIFDLNQLINDKYKLAKAIDIQDVFIGDDSLTFSLSLQTNLQDLLEYITIDRE